MSRLQAEAIREMLSDGYYTSGSKLQIGEALMKIKWAMSRGRPPRARGGNLRELMGSYEKL